MNPVVLAKLERLKSAPKFVDEPGTSFNGMRPEALRRASEALLNDLIDRLMLVPDAQPSKKFVLALFAEALAAFPAYDTEDRERMCRYVEEIMDIVGVQSADGVLNRWLYGPILGTLVSLPGLLKRG